MDSLAEDLTPIKSVGASRSRPMPIPIGKPPDGREKRRHPRYAVGLPIKVRILIEEQTFSPFTFEGTCENISQSGALATVSHFSLEIYKQLIQRPRYIRLVCNLPGREKPLTLFGKLVWYDFRRDPASSTCKLGINFEPMKDDTMGRLEKYLNDAAKECELVS